MPTFHMEFHLPFFALREPSTPNGTLPKAPRKLLRNRKDLSLLRQESTGPEDQENYWLYQAEVSCVVYGCDEWQWTAYAFVDTKHDGDEDGNGNDIYDSENEVDCFQQEIDEDPIASVRARQPIWRPRQYFLKAFETRVQEPRREWDELVHRLVVDIREYVCLKYLNLKRYRAQVCKLNSSRNVHIYLQVLTLLETQENGVKR
jgi:hypothetical protein